MDVAIIDYRAGNLTSVQRALHHLGVDATVTADPQQVAQASRVIFPGVGAAKSCMANLTGMGHADALREAVAAGKPVLGICVGMQLLFEFSEEDGGVPCLGLVPGSVRLFPADLVDGDGARLKVPHMGWNPVRFAEDPLTAGIPEGSQYYFVHSYFCDPKPGVSLLASSDHGQDFCAGIRADNLAAVQFHPEKSGPVGLKLLANFLEIPYAV
jgi:glutamine amidotransferase